MECGKISFIEVHEPRGFGVEDSEEESSEDLSKLSVAELKDRLKAKGLPVGGKKSELIERLSSQEEE